MIQKLIRATCTVGFAMVAVLTPHLRGEIAITDVEISKFLLAAAAYHQGLSSISVKYEINSKMDPEWKKMRGITTDEYDDILYHIDFVCTESAYKAELKSFYTDRTLQREVAVSLNGREMRVLHRTGDSLMLIHNNSDGEPDNGFAGNNLFFLPYSFLSSKPDADNRVSVSLSDLKSESTWASLIDKIDSVDEVEMLGRKCYKISIKHDDDILDSVYFDRAVEGLVLGLDRYDSDGKLRRQVRVTEISDVVNSGGGPDFIFPLKITYITVNKLDGFYVKGSMRTGEIKNMEFNSVPPNSDLNIDPALASLIYDEQEKVYIRVPK